jgi:hypothetical protein
VGRLEFVTHTVSVNGRVLYNTADDVFEPLISKEFYRTIGFKEIAMIYGNTESSYRKTSNLINRVRLQETGGTPYRTLQENTEQEGLRLNDHIAAKTRAILSCHEFDEENVYRGCTETYNISTPIVLPFDDIQEAAMSLSSDFNRAEMVNNPVPYEDPEHSVNIAIDDVIVKKQEEIREKQREVGKRKRKYVHNTVVHVRKGDQNYTINGHGMKNVLCFLIAFIFNSKLTGNRFQFFTDGHKTLNETIFKCFSWYKNIGLVLDWYHLNKKCKEQLSMAMKGRVVRNELLLQLLPILWHGLTDRAITLLNEIDSSQIKDISRLEKLMGYLDRNRPYIPCYAIRKELGLCNSSAIGEKMNDILVADRQKHNGMSWSASGSVALATVTCLKRNNESSKWFEEQDIDFKFAA